MEITRNICWTRIGNATRDKMEGDFFGAFRGVLLVIVVVGEGRELALDNLHGYNGAEPMGAIVRGLYGGEGKGESFFGGDFTK